VASGNVKRLRIAGKATVHLGDWARGGLTRGDHKACDHDLGGKEQSIPCGRVDAKTGHLRSTFGRASKPSACIVDTLEARWNALDAPEKAATELLQIPMDHGPASRGVRTQVLHRMGQCADQIGTPIHRLYDPPDHSTYHPIERCWGLRELHWHGTKLVEVETRLAWATSMTWQGIHPVVALSRQGYQKGMTLGKKARRAVERRLERHPELPKWDMLIRPASTA
jgi:hypothetical protein